MVATVCLLAVLCADGEPGWGDEPDSIDGFRRTTERDLVANADLQGQRVYLDGKFGGATRDQVLLRASQVALLSGGRPFDPERFGSFRRDANVRVFGTVARTGEKPAITVARIERQPDDSQRYHRARRRLRRDDAAGLYALARRLRARFERYGGDDLVRWARETAGEAVEADVAGHRDQPAALYDLAERARTLVGDEGLRTRIIEAALTAERRQLAAGDAAASLRLAEKWDRLLPHRPEPAFLRRAALLIEERALRAADVEAHYALAQRLQRLLGDGAHALDLTRRGLAAEEKALGPLDYAGRYRLSRKVAEAAGDAAWSRRLLAEGVAAERRQLAGRPPVDYFRLAERCADQLGEVASGRALIREGLLVQERRLDPRDLNGHLELAIEYLTRLGDRGACIERLRACLRLVPDEPRVRAKLTELGLVEVAGRWHEAQTVRSDPKLAWEARIEQAIAAGRIELGMAPHHVRRAWGEPLRRDAHFSRNARTVQWTYPGVRPTCVLFRNGRVVAWSR